MKVVAWIHPAAIVWYTAAEYREYCNLALGDTDRNKINNSSVVSIKEREGHRSL
jgi:hypothetical protein